MHITFAGVDIDSFLFDQPWPKARFRQGRHFMDERFRLEAVDDTRKVKVFRTVRASDGLQHAKPFWYRYFGDLSAELETILDGTFTVAKNGLPMRPIFQRNHPSWEEDARSAVLVFFSMVQRWLARIRGAPSQTPTLHSSSWLGAQKYASAPQAYH